MQLTDSKAVELAKLLRLYFEDCVAEDPTTTLPSNLSVLELLEDLEMSADQGTDELIGKQLTAILDLFA